MIGKISELLVSGSHPAVSDAATSPRSPLDCKIHSPRGLKMYDVGGVGLGIVAALEKKCSDVSRHEILVKYAVAGPNKSDPIPCAKNFKTGFQDTDTDTDADAESLENYTYVTCHGPNKSTTKVYYDGRIASDERIGCHNKESPPRFLHHFSGYPTLDFLSSCHLCGKKLHGEDIYMYRGEKAFCSTECRSRQIMMDERKEQCRSEASRSAETSSSPYTAGQIFSTGILAI